MAENEQKHVVAIFGAAVSGAEAASRLAEQGIEVLVFDQNLLPYGKIEDGLPKWHAKLRDREEARIDERLQHPHITFVPGVRLGRDIALEDIAMQWGVSAVLLATGAWRDRSLPLAGADAFIGKGLIYQNSFIYWFNHKHEPAYEGPVYEVADGAIIVGGGLASLDVAKVIMFELVGNALARLGDPVDLFTLDRGLDRVLAERNLSLQDLGIQGCTLFYRRRIEDMPLAPQSGDGGDPEHQAKQRRIQEKIFHNYQRKYLFRVAPCRMPVQLIVENDRLAGLVFQETEIVDGEPRPVPGAIQEVRTPLTISSIGSIPEPIPGLPMQGQVFKLCGEDCCRIEGYRNVFALGNAVTGRGNIRDSQLHGRYIAESMLERYLQEEHKYEQRFRLAEDHVQNRMERLAQHLEVLAAPTHRQRIDIESRIRALQARVGYSGNYPEWIARHRPPRLEAI